MRFLCAILCFSTFSAWAQAPVPTLDTSINGIEIGGLEYWPFIDNKPHPYPDAVIWSHEEAGEKNMTAAMECMVKSSTRLTSWLEDTNSPVYGKLKELKRRGGPSRFWMWTNDYTLAPLMPENSRRRAHVWHWCEDPTFPDCGWLKFESTVGPDGVCKMPEDQQVSTYLQSRIDRLPEPLQPEGAEEPNIIGNDRSVPRGDLSDPRSTANGVSAGTR